MKERPRRRRPRERKEMVRGVATGILVPVAAFLSLGFLMLAPEAVAQEADRPNTDDQIVLTGRGSLQGGPAIR
jgi:hypothetical protein